MVWHHQQGTASFWRVNHSSRPPGWTGQLGTSIGSWHSRGCLQRTSFLLSFHLAVGFQITGTLYGCGVGGIYSLLSERPSARGQRDSASFFPSTHPTINVLKACPKVKSTFMTSSFMVFRIVPESTLSQGKCILMVSNQDERCVGLLLNMDEHRKKYCHLIH